MDALAWPLVALVALWRADAWVRAWLAQSRPEAAPRVPEVAVPDDLQAFALQWQDAWAQDEQLAAMRDRYRELKDWNAVRRAFGIGVRVEADG